MKRYKPTSLALIAAVAVAFVTPSLAENKKPIPGPKGGKILNDDPPRAEFFVEKDHTVTISFYGADMKQVPVTTQTAVVFADSKSGRVKLDFEKKGDVLVSKTPLPSGDGYNVMVQLKPTPDAKPQNTKISYHTEPCGECKMAEYACICPPDKEHGHREKDHKEGESPKK